MKRVTIISLLFMLSVLFLGCPGIGKIDKQAAEEAITKIRDTHGENVLDIKVYRDKLEIAFPKDLHPWKKSQIFMECAELWWNAYPGGKKPGHRLYCYAYDDVISDDDIGSLQITKGISDTRPTISGQPGIYALRDIK